MTVFIEVFLSDEIIFVHDFGVKTPGCSKFVLGQNTLKGWTVAKYGKKINTTQALSFISWYAALSEKNNKIIPFSFKVHVK